MSTGEDLEDTGTKLLPEVSVSSSMTEEKCICVLDVCGLLFSRG